MGSAENETQKPGALHLLNLKCPTIDVSSPLPGPLPDWASFYVWLGWWMRRNVTPSRRLIALVVSPSRGTCAAFAGLGALIEAAQRYENVLSWDALTGVPIDAEVFFRVRNDNLKGGRQQLEGRIRGHGQDYIEIDRVRSVGSRKKNSYDVVWTIFRHRFEEYAFTVEIPPTRVQSVSYEKSVRFYEEAISLFNRQWLWSGGTDCVIVTSRVQFMQTIDDVVLSSAGRDTHKLTDLLCLAGLDDEAHAKLRVATPRSDLRNTRGCMLTVLDGLDALSVREHTQSPNLIFILERGEVTEFARDLVLQLRNARDDSLLPPDSGMRDSIPFGLEVDVFALAGTV